MTKDRTPGEGADLTFDYSNATKAIRKPRAYWLTPFPFVLLTFFLSYFHAKFSLFSRLLACSAFRLAFFRQRVTLQGAGSNRLRFHRWSEKGPHERQFTDPTEEMLESAKWLFSKGRGCEGGRGYRQSTSYYFQFPITLLQRIGMGRPSG